MSDPLSTGLGLIGNVRTAVELGLNLRDLVKDTAAAEKVSQLVAALIAAREDAFNIHESKLALAERVRQLEAHIREHEDWAREKANYALTQTGAGALVYRQKPEAQSVEPPHDLCPRCFQDDKKSILQPTDNIGVRRHRVFMCPRCSSEFATGDQAPPPTPINFSRPF